MTMAERVELNDLTLALQRLQLRVALLEVLVAKSLPLEPVADAPRKVARR